MNERRWVLWIVLAVMVIGLAVVLLAPKVEQVLEPQPRRALVAIERSGSGIAVVGPVDVEAGEAFTLHAVLEAEDRSGETIYFTEAPSLRIEGAEISGASLRPWDGARTARVLWFSIEGPASYYELAAPDQISRFQMIEFFHPEWPSGWQVRGRLDPRFDEGVTGGDRGADESKARPEADGLETGFGTQRYHVRIELFAQEDDVLPVESFRSESAERALAAPETYPTASVALPGPLGNVSRYFGVTQIGLDESYEGSVPTEWTSQITTWTRQKLAFSRLSLIAEVLRSADRTLDDLEWQLVNADGEVPWRSLEDDGVSDQGTEGVEPGDLLRAGSRIVFLYQDRGIVGRLDRDDLCFDFDRGAIVRPLGAVFIGSGDLEWARL